MTDRAPAPADVEAIAALREQLAADLYMAVDWSGCDGSRWSKVPTVHRRKWYALADAALASPALATLHAQADDYRAAWRTAGESADRFRDVLSECLGRDDENPGDDVLIAELREHFGKTGPEPRRWRDFLVGAEAQLDQIRADRQEPQP